MSKRKRNQNKQKNIKKQLQVKSTNKVTFRNEKDKKGIHQFFSTLIVEFIYIFLAEILFKIVLGSFSFDWTLLRIFASTAIISGLLALVTTNIKPVIRKIILIVFNIFVVFYAWLQLGFIDFLGTFISMGNAEQGTKITSYILDFLVSVSLKAYLLYLLFALFIVYLVLEKKIVKRDKIIFKNGFVDAALIWYFAFFTVLFYTTVTVDFMQNKYQTVSNKSLLSYPSNPAVAIKNYGTSVYFLLDLKGTIKGGVEDVYASNTVNKKQDSITREIDDTAWESIIKNESDASFNILNNYFINRPITEKNDYTGLFEGKNLIVLMLESVSFAVFDEAYKDYFPTLYKLQSEGISGVNNFSPKNNCATGESEMTSAISLYSIETTCTVNTYKKNVYPEALLSMFKNNGYYTSAYHDYTEQYYYRSVFEPNFGSSAYYGVEELGMKYNPLYKEWPSDVTFIDSALPKFINEDRFASYLVTVTSHSPYMYNSEWGNAYLDLFDDLDMDKSSKRYLSKVKVVDLALQKLLESLEEKGILDDTVIVLFGDHYPYALSDKEFASIAKYDIDENQEVDRTPFIIYNSATDAQIITKYTSPLDYTPTLLNLFGIEYDPRHYLGNDIFSDYEDFVLFPDNSWQSEYGFYSANKGEFIAKSETKTLSDEQIITMNNKMTELRNMSALAIKKDYFNYLFKRLNEEKQKIKENEVTTEETEEKQ